MEQVEVLVGPYDTGRLKNFSKEVSASGGFAGDVDSVLEKIKMASNETPR